MIKCYIIFLILCVANGIESYNSTLDAVATRVIRNGECGGTIELDHGSLFYPGDGSIQPGEICIWTIHLQTMDGFRMNLSTLNMPGGNSSCFRSAVSIYGLSNLIPRDNLETYRLCNENNNVGNYFVTSNIATVVLYTSSTFPANDSSNGFVLYWEGSRFQPMPTEHTSAYSVAPSGVIWFPFEGEYPPNAGMTWLVKGVRSSNPEPTLVDIDVIFVDMENCNLSDKCLCDALIIYDISRTGVLHEVERFCGDKSNGQFQNVNSNFIVAFYTDTVDSPQSGYGFQVAWRQGSGQTTTTESSTVTDPWTDPQTTQTEDYLTTEQTTPDYWYTSTEDPWQTTPEPVYSTECGGILEGTEGYISYKYQQAYENNERCIWTIRLSPAYNQIDFVKESSGFDLIADVITILSFVKNNTGLENQIFLGAENGREEFIVNGVVAIVQFVSDSTTVGTGFLLHFRATGSPSTDVGYYSDISFIPPYYGELRYPPNGSYHDNELSTFVITNGKSMAMFMDLDAYVYAAGIETCNSCNCDGLLIYSLEYDTAVRVDRVCETGNNLHHAQTFIVVFYSNPSVTKAGFMLYYANWGANNTHLSL